MMKTVLATTCALSLVACVKQDAPPQDIDHAIPTADQVSIKLPDGASRVLARSSEQNQDAVGQLASWYVATRDVTRTFNGGSAWVLVLVHTIVQFPVTTVNGDTFTWGPWSQALDPAEYKLDVRAVGDGTYEYKLSGRSKTQADAKFEVVIDGTSDPRAGDLKGTGEFLIDFDAGKRVNPIDSGDAKGSVDVKYDLAKQHLDLTIMSTDAAGKPVLADYAYNQTADGGGDMVFDVSSNIGGSAALETLTLRSRWLDTGAGRADARIGGGDLGALQATASECWDTMFKRVFYTDSAGFASTEGVQSACAYATADLPLPK
ncbi:MAG TPA: hypothetical protein VHN14_00285 [Kofleriaceae bacterium]|jgi:hypothetical protein|nr:hypothetical protein [Kofleriaceae bacterium]